MKQFYVYLHCKPDGTPFYVGKGTKRRTLLLYRDSNKHYNNVISKYGKENIIIQVQCCMDEQEAFEQEILHIQVLRDIGIKLCNCTDGGEGSSGLKRPESVKQKISKALKGRTKSEETKNKIRLHMLGTKMPEETKQLLRIKLKGNRCAFGSKRSKEFKIKNTRIQKRLRWITDGNVETRIDQDVCIPQGFRYGRCYSKQPVK